mmetsp:Transcript_1180/g.4613  ORF Transcript_1180/g.4613 Transcript_1180/m.4613 type:complete len:392 (+) Transcript_1180:1226-2401(+)
MDPRERLVLDRLVPPRVDQEGVVRARQREALAATPQRDEEHRRRGVRVALESAHDGAALLGRDGARDDVGPHAGLRLEPLAAPRERPDELREHDHLLAGGHGTHGVAHRRELRGVVVVVVASAARRILRRQRLVDEEPRARGAERDDVGALERLPTQRARAAAERHEARGALLAVVVQTRQRARLGRGRRVEAHAALEDARRVGAGLLRRSRGGIGSISALFEISFGDERLLDVGEDLLGLRLGELRCRRRRPAGGPAGLVEQQLEASFRGVDALLVDERRAGRADLAQPRERLEDVRVVAEGVVAERVDRGARRLEEGVVGLAVGATGAEDVDVARLERARRQLEDRLAAAQRERAEEHAQAREPGGVAVADAPRHGPLKDGRIVDGRRS